jgi:hypothetical protein
MERELVPSRDGIGIVIRPALISAGIAQICAAVL